MLMLEGFAATTFIQTIRVKIHVYKSGTYGGIRPKSDQGASAKKIFEQIRLSLFQFREAGALSI